MHIARGDIGNQIRLAAPATQASQGTKWSQQSSSFHSCPLCPILTKSQPA